MENTNAQKKDPQIPYLSIAAIIFTFGMIACYLLVDLYVQRKANLSVLQIVKLVEQDEKRRAKDVKDGKPVRIYKFFINDTEHNFSFKNFSINGLKFDGNEIEYLKTKNKKEK